MSKQTYWVLGTGDKTKAIQAVMDKRLKRLENIDCPQLVKKIINKEVTVQEKDVLVMNFEHKIQNFIGTGFLTFMLC